MALALAILSLASCKKETEVLAAPGIEGTWVGEYEGGLYSSPKFFSFIIKNDGTLIVKSGDPNAPLTGTGTWSLTDTEFRSVYQYEGQLSKWNVAAKADIEKGEMSGAYGAGETDADDGTFYLTRQ